MEKIYKIIPKKELHLLIRSGNSQYNQSKKLNDGSIAEIYLGLVICIVINKKIHRFFDHIEGLHYYGALKSDVTPKKPIIIPDISLSLYTPESLLSELSKNH